MGVLADTRVFSSVAQRHGRLVCCFVGDFITQFRDAGSTLGVWVAHGEGQAYFPDKGTQEFVVANNLAPVRYVDDDNQVLLYA
jgi:phosphoribosylformylglycinamidine (FGAM) synthase-like amidotransferase family enzyme